MYLNHFWKLGIASILTIALQGCEWKEKTTNSVFNFPLKEFYILHSSYDDSLVRFKINSIFFRHDTLFSCIRDSNGIRRYAKIVLDSNEIRQIQNGIDASRLFRMIQIHESKKDSLKNRMQVYCGPFFALRDTINQLHFFTPLALDSLNYEIFNGWYKSLIGFTGKNSWAGAELFSEKEKDLLDTMKAKLPPMPKVSTIHFVPPEIKGGK